MELITLIMWISGCWYFSKLTSKIKELERQVFILSVNTNKEV